VKEILHFVQNDRLSSYIFGTVVDRVIKTGLEAVGLTYLGLHGILTYRLQPGFGFEIGLQAGNIQSQLFWV
jgi:hypothetical protein